MSAGKSRGHYNGPKQDSDQNLKKKTFNYRQRAVSNML